MNSRSILWTWAELCTALGLPVAVGPDVTRVIVDSRTVQPGDLFVALPGDPGSRFNPGHRSAIDGHDFVTDAIDKGAVGAMVHRPTIKMIDGSQTGGPPELLVDDTYDGLWTLGAAARTRLEGNVIAVTGSSGKTTFKTFLAAALSGYAPPGSFNNHIGVPLSLVNAPPHASACVFEVGTNHPGEIAPLANMVEPTIAVVLNVHNAHIQNFKDSAELITEKLSIFNNIRNISNRICEEKVANKVTGGARTFGYDPASDAHVISLTGDLMHAQVLGQTVTANVPGGGAHRAQTLLAALLTTALLDHDLAAACDLPSTLLPSGRGNLITVNGIDIVDDSYNANPSSMAAAIKAFLQQSGPDCRRIALLGEMAELGDVGPDAHTEIAQSFTEFDDVIAIGAAFEHSGAPHWYSAADDTLLEHLCTLLDTGDRVLVKGSNSVFWSQRFVERLTERLRTST